MDGYLTNDRKRFSSANDCKLYDSRSFPVGARRLYDPIDRSVTATNENMCIQNGSCDRFGVGLGKVPRRQGWTDTAVSYLLDLISYG